MTVSKVQSTVMDTGYVTLCQAALQSFICNSGGYNTAHLSGNDFLDIPGIFDASFTIFPASLLTTWSMKTIPPKKSHSFCQFFDKLSKRSPECWVACFPQSKPQNILNVQGFS